MIIHAAPIEVKERVVAPRVASTKAFSMASLAADHRAANQQTTAATHTTHVTEVHVTNIVGGARGGRGGSRGRRVMKKQASFLNQLRGKVLAPSAVASVDEEDRRSGALKSSFLSSMRGNIGKQ